MAGSCTRPAASPHTPSPAAISSPTLRGPKRCGSSAASWAWRLERSPKPCLNCCADNPDRDDARRLRSHPAHRCVVDYTPVDRRRAGFLFRIPDLSGVQRHLRVVEPYISPAVAPPVFTPASGYPGAVPVEHAWFGAFPSWWPSFLPQSPAFFLPGLAILFRFTCYYYRGAFTRRLR